MGHFSELDATPDRTPDDDWLDRADGLLFGEPISTYTRAQALADSVLIDVSALARAAGIVYPTAITAALSADVDAIPSYLQGVASREGRLWDLVWMAYIAIIAAPADAACLTYELILPVGEDAPYGFDAVYAVVAVCGPGDDARPVITLMKPGES